MKCLRFGGPALGPGQKTWFETRKALEEDPDNPGQQVMVGGDTVIAEHGLVVVAEDLGVHQGTGGSWADYHVRTGRASWVEEPIKPGLKPEATKE